MQLIQDKIQKKFTHRWTDLQEAQKIKIWTEFENDYPISTDA